YFDADALRSALFSLASFAVASAAASLVRHQEPRRIVLLGSSLAGAQFLHPICGAATTLVLPFALRRALADAGTKHGTGLYVSLLFIPVLTFLYQSISQPELAVLTSLPGKLSTPFPLLVLAPLAAAVPVVCATATLRDSVPLPVLAVIAAVAGVGVLGTLLGFQQRNLASAVL